MDRLLERFEHRVSVDSILQSSNPPLMRAISAPHEQGRGKTFVPEHRHARDARQQDSLEVLSPVAKEERGLKLETTSEVVEEDRRGRTSNSPGVKRTRVSDSPKVPEGGYGVRGGGGGSECGRRGGAGGDQGKWCEGGSGCGSKGGGEGGKGCGGGGWGDGGGGGVETRARGNEISCNQVRCSEKADDVFVSCHDSKENEAEEEVEEKDEEDWKEDPYWTATESSRHQDLTQRRCGPGSDVVDGRGYSSRENSRQRCEGSVQNQWKAPSPVYAKGPRFAKEGIDREISRTNVKKDVRHCEAKVGSVYGNVGGAFIKGGDVVRNEGTCLAKEIIFPDITCTSKNVGREMSDGCSDDGTVAKGEWHVAGHSYHGDGEQDVGSRKEVRRWGVRGRGEKAGNGMRGKSEDVWDSSEEIEVLREEEREEVSSSRNESDRNVRRTKTGSSATEMTALGKAATGPVLKQKDEQKHRLQELQDALDSTPHDIYSHEGRMDEFKFTLHDQKVLVTQLISEHQSVCVKRRGRENAIMSTSRASCATVGVGSVVDFCHGDPSLKAVFERAKVDRLHGYLPDRVMEVMFTDRQLVRNPLGISGGMESKFHDIDTLISATRMESSLLKLLVPDFLVSRSENLEPNIVNGSIVEGDEVDDPAIVHKVVSNTRLNPQAPSMTERLHVNRTVWADLKIPPSLTPAPSSSTSMASMSPSSSSVPKPVVGVLPTSWDLRNKVWGGSVDDVLPLPLSETSAAPGHASLLFFPQASSPWANPDLLTTVFSERKCCPSMLDGEREGDVSKSCSRGDASSDRMSLMNEESVLPATMPSALPLAPGNDDWLKVPSYFPRAIGSEFKTMQSTTSCDTKTMSCDFDVVCESKGQSNSITGVVLPLAKLCEENVEEDDDDILLHSHSSFSLGDKFHSDSSLSHFSISSTSGMSTANHTSTKITENNQMTHGNVHIKANYSEPASSLSRSGSSYLHDSLMPCACSIPKHTPFYLLNSHTDITEDPSDDNKQCHATEIASFDWTSGEDGFPRAEGEEERGDIGFLMECFPDLELLYLQRLLALNGGSVEKTVSVALLSPPVGSVHVNFDYPSSDHFQTHLNLSARCMTLSSIGSDVGSASSVELATMTSTVTKIRPPHHSNAGTAAGDSNSTTKIRPLKLQEMVSKGVKMKSQGDFLQLEAWVDPAANGKPRQQSDESVNDFLVWDVEEDEVDRDEALALAEDNLMLKLTPSLALQLQSLFGAVDHFLPLKGGILLMVVCML